LFKGKASGKKLACILVHWKKVACGAFFLTAALLPPAKGVTFAGCLVAPFGVQ
jgi:hypothetical protein